MCYTSGTTGNPKGVLYSHRSNILHSMIACSADMLGQTSRDVVMPVVPLFHANGWSLAFSAPMVGASMVMPGPKLDGASVYELLTDYKVTLHGGGADRVARPAAISRDDRAKASLSQRVLIGGSACPRMVIEKFQDVYGVDVFHAWGMTEMSPLGTVCT